MSDKLTPEELSRFKLEAARNSNLLAGELFDHIAAVEAERDALAEVVREVATIIPYPFYDDSCVFCGQFKWQPHTDVCLIPRARQALAAMELKP